jgi:hypothetical protein
LAVELIAAAFVRSPRGVSEVGGTGKNASLSLCLFFFFFLFAIFSSSLLRQVIESRRIRFGTDPTDDRRLFLARSGSLRDHCMDSMAMSCSPDGKGVSTRCCAIDFWFVAIIVS